MKLRDLLFVGMNMADTTRKLLDEKEDEICEFMTDNERKAYKFGLDTFTSLLTSLLEPRENEVFVHIPDCIIQKEFDIDDLLKHIEN